MLGLIEGLFYVDYQWISFLLSGILEKKIKYIINTRCGTLLEWVVFSTLSSYDKIIFSNNNTNYFFDLFFNFQVINNEKV